MRPRLGHDTPHRFKASNFYAVFPRPLALCLPIRVALLLLLRVKKPVHTCTRRACEGGRVMPFVLSLVMVIAIGSLAVLIVPWTGRFHMTPRRQRSPLERWLTCAVAPPPAQASSARVNASREESQGLEAVPQYYGDSCLIDYDEDGAWKVLTFVCHMPRLSAEERQGLLATWG